MLSSLVRAQQYNFQYFSVSNGLAQSQVLCMLEDQRGYLWLGTQGGGLNRFDGLSFEVFTVRNGLINNNVDVLYEHDHLIFIGARNGFSVFDGRDFKNYFLEKDENIAVNAFIAFSGKVLIGTSAGVYEFENEVLEYAKQLNGDTPSNINQFLVTAEGDLWMGTDRGALRYKNDQLKAFQSAQGLTNAKVSDLATGPDAVLWFGTYAGAYKYENDRFTNVSASVLTTAGSSGGSASNYINTILADDSGQIWWGTQDQGISIFQPADTSWLQLTDELGLCNNNVKALLQDSWGSIWIGTSGGGVCKYVGQQFSHIDLSNRPGDNLVYAITQDTSSAMWLAAADDGVVRLDSAGMTRFNRANGFADTKTKALLNDSKGRLWLGTNDYGIAHFDGNSFEFLSNNNRAVGRLCKDLIEDKEGNIWVASSSEGVLKIAPRDTFMQIAEVSFDSLYFNDSLILRTDTIRRDSVALRYAVESIPSLPTNINDLHFDQMGRLWFASRFYGVGYWTEKGVVRYNTEEGLPTNDIRSIVEDEHGHLWIGTAGYGVVRIDLYSDSLNLLVYNENDGLSSGNVYLLAIDPVGDLWVGCGRGVDRIELDEEQQVKSIRAYRRADGFLGAETCQNASFLDKAGHLWFGTIDGATKYIPGTLQRNLIPPKLHFEQVELLNQPFEQTSFAKWLNFDNQFKKGLSLPYRQNDLNFEFKGINLANPRQVAYQWMLEGRDSDWSRRSTKTSVNYTNLPPGDYTFKVRAFNEDLIFNVDPLATSFSIQTPIWQRPWFIALSLLLLASMITLSFRYRVRQVKRKAKAEQERLEMENQVLQLEQKALQLQMNPHFIFNALNTVQSLFMSQDQGSARKLLSQFAKLMRAILEHSRTNAITLKQEIDLLRNYLSIEQFSRPNNFDFDIKVDPSLDPEEVSIPPMLIQPFVENAIIHGVGHLKTAGQIDLQFVRFGSQLQCTIRDNGIGRKAAAKIQAQNTRSHQSVAMQVTKDRLNLFRGAGAKDPQFELLDLVDEQGKPSGTEVRLLMPLEEW